MNKRARQQQICDNNSFVGTQGVVTYNPLITSDNNNNIITSFVYYQGAGFSSFNIDGDVIPLSGSTQINPYHIVVVKFNSDGVLQWSNFAIEDNPDVITDCNSIIADNDGNIFLYGRASNNCKFGSYYFETNYREELGINPNATFLAKISLSGVWQFVKELSTNSQNYLEQGVGNPDLLTTDNLNNLYALINSRGGNSILGEPVSIDQTTTHLAKLDNNGNKIWVKGFGTADAYANSICFTNNSLYVAGGIRNYIRDGIKWYFSELTVKPSSPLDANGTMEYFISKADTEGDFKWVSSFSGDNYIATGFAVKVINDNIYTSGYYRKQITTLGNLNGSYSSDNSFTQNVFFGKLKDQYIRIGDVSPISLCPGATFTIPFTSFGLTFSSTNIFTAQISDVNGDFTNATNVGSVISTGSGTITATLPADIPQGSTGYKIRIISSDLLATGFPYHAYADLSYTLTATIQTYYEDADGDNFGNAEISLQTCTPPSNYVLDNTDCDDTDNTVYPGAPELCDGKDNDCDGDVDEGVKTTFYLDADNDGYGDPNSPIQACIAPQGYVADNTDCNDEDETVHPGATEIPDDGIDQDCDGADLISPDISAPMILADPVLTIFDCNSISISWETDEPATSAISLHDGENLFIEQNNNLLTSHNIVFLGLTAGTTYTYSIDVTDAFSN